jgi:adenylate cyclase
MQLDLEKRLKGTRSRTIVQELLTNSLHFPLANIILEIFIESPAKYFMSPDFYAIAGASVVQAFILGSWRHQGKSHRFLGNLIGPGVYTVFELLIEGSKFFSSPNHIAYWIFAFIIGLVQQIQDRTAGKWTDLLTILEHLIRTCILLVMYIIFESIINPEPGALRSFLSDKSHLFITIVIVLLGTIVGFAHVTANAYLLILQQTAKQLRTFSEWFLGRDLLSAAIKDDAVLTLQRKTRTVFFMDIRGFTSWSEKKSPDEVVTLLNTYFETAEDLWEGASVIKVKHTADEIMAVFPTAQDAVDTAIRLNQTMGAFLHQHGLSAGIGMHQGELVEGLIGSKHLKLYDIIGDTVNTTKRICDQAKGDELLITEAVYQNLNKENIAILDSRNLIAKGKSEPISVFSIQSKDRPRTGG